MSPITAQQKAGIRTPDRQKEVIRDRADLYAQKGPKKAPEDMDAEVTDEDIAALGDPDKDNDMNDDEMTDDALLDDTDEEGDLLNEGEATSDGTQLDLPLEEEADNDEENDYYSLDDQEEDPLP